MSFNELDPDGISASTPGAAGAFDVTAILKTALRYYWIPLVTTGMAILAGFAYLKTAEPVYRSSGEIKVERRTDRDPDAEQGEAVSLFENAAAEDLKTIERVFLSPALIDRVIKALDLGARDGFVSKGLPARDVSEGDLRTYLATQSQVSLIPDTRLIQVSFESWNPVIAQEVARALVKEGIDYYRDQRMEAVNTNIRNLREETKKLENNLMGSEEKLNDYMRKLGSVSVDQELNLVALQLRELNSTLSVLKTERLKFESDFVQIAESRDDADKLILIRSVRDLPSVLALSSRANELRGNFAKIQERYGFKHPYKRQAESELNAVEQSLKEEVLKAPQSIETALNVARRNEQSLIEEQAKLEAKVIQIKAQAVEFQVFQRQVDADRLSYETALKRLNKELAQGRIQPVLIQAVGEPGYGYRASLGPIRILATSLVGGLMLGAGIILLLAQSDKSFQSVEDIERTLGLSVLASVPIVLPPEGESFLPRKCPVPVQDDRESSAAEAFRTLTAFLQADEAAGLGQLVLLTSAEGGEGKSFCCLNLAVAQAQSGQRTLLVDASLSRPVMGEWLLGEGENVGLSDYLLGEASFSSIIMASPYSNLDLVTAGASRSHFVEIFSRSRFREFLEEARVLYDQIIFDTAPITTASDTLSFARFFPVICLVVEAGKTSRESVVRATELLTRAGAKPTGVVFSRDRQRDIRRKPLRAVSELDSEVLCASCGRRYSSREECIRSTVPCGGSAFARQCSCGGAIVLPRASRRDSSAQGQLRRDIFGELLDRLQAAGLPRDKARAMLLLTLKVWRNEIGEDPQRDTSQAGMRRRELIETFLTEVGKAGLGREEAQAKLLEAAKSWRNAP